MNTTRDYSSPETIKRMFNKSLTLNDNLESWHRTYFNESHTLQDRFFKNDSQLTEFCYTLKSLSTADSTNSTDTETNNTSFVLAPEKSVEFLNQLRNCFNVTTVTPAEEYWEWVKVSIVVIYFDEFSWISILL